MPAFPARRPALGPYARGSALALAVALSTAAFARQAPGPAPDPAAARAFVESIRPSPALQALLDAAVAEVVRDDPKFAASRPRVAVLDPGCGAAPCLASLRGDEGGYPASVVKFVYLMAAYAWQEKGLLEIDDALDRQLDEMIRQSSNAATQQVFARLTGTSPGPALGQEEYAAYRERRLAVKRWLESLGVRGLHAVNPTYDGGGDISGRDEQFLRDAGVDGARRDDGGKFPNRVSMTAVATVELLGLLGADLALTSADSETVRTRMKRDPRQQPHLAARIAGGAARIPGATAFAKSGTWGPVYADAGLVAHPSGRRFAIAVFTEASPPYRGDAIARLTARLGAGIFAASQGDLPR